MARTSVMTGGTNGFQSTAEDLNAVATDFISNGVVGTLTNTVGVSPSTGGLSVNAQGTPNTTTAIGAGIAYVTATPTGQASQNLRVKIDAQNYTHSSNTSGATRYDWIYVQVDPTLANTPATLGNTTGTIAVSRSTSTSTDNGTPPTYGTLVAIVTLANTFTTVVNGNIADKRTLAGTATAITIGYTEVTASQTIAAVGTTDLTGLSVTVTVPTGGRKVRITGFIGNVANIGGGDNFCDLLIMEGATNIQTSRNRIIGGDQRYMICSRVITPTAGSHTYKLSATQSSANSMAWTTLGTSYIHVEAV